MLVPAALTMDNAGQALEAGLRAIEAGQTEFDLGAMASFDSAAVAALLTWQRAAHARGQRLQLLNVPPGLRGLIDLYGVSGLLLPA